MKHVSIAELKILLSEPLGRYLYRFYFIIACHFHYVRMSLPVTVLALKRVQMLEEKCTFTDIIFFQKIIAIELVTRFQKVIFIENFQ